MNYLPVHHAMQNPAVGETLRDKAASRPSLDTGGAGGGRAVRACEVKCGNWEV